MSDYIVGSADDTGYHAYLEELRERFNLLTNGHQLFETNATGIFEHFLVTLRPDRQQHYNCRCCRAFMERYGHLVLIADDGSLVSPIWQITRHTPRELMNAINHCQAYVAQHTVTGAFFDDERTWGTPQSKKGWQHMAITVSNNRYQSPSKLKSAYQHKAEKLEDFKNVMTALDLYGQDVTSQAVALLKSDSLYAGERCLGVAEWMMECYALLAAKTPKSANLLQAKIARAPAGLCHIRTSMIGTLLDDLLLHKQGRMNLELVKRRFADKMAPDVYMRPTELPKEGNKARGDEIVAKLGLQDSFRRRFAKLSEASLIWAPAVSAGSSGEGGFFSDVPAKGRSIDRGKRSTMPTVDNGNMTWEKFRQKVLDQGCKDLHIWVGRGSMGFGALTTNVIPDAPPIIQWDLEDCRNPVSWYVYTQGSLPGQWGLTADNWCRVVGICQLPFQWNVDRFAHHGDGAMLLLEGCSDRLNSTSALFPAQMKSELHEIRATVEAYSLSHPLELSSEGGQLASGIKLSKNDTFGVKVRATMNSGITITVTLDRWE